LLPGVLRSWPACRVPVLGLWSSRDHCLAEGQMARSGRRVTAAWRYERIEGAGHWLPLERPEQVAQLALEWFS
jgi:pimeloyl-ACP methyl ester carboxylesterase